MKVIFCILFSVLTIASGENSNGTWSAAGKTVINIETFD